MTDLTGGLAPMLGCDSCGAEVPVEDAVGRGFDCPHCGAPLPGRPDYSFEAGNALEVVRGYGALGYVDSMEPAGEGLQCSACGRVSAPERFAIDALRAVDDPGEAAEAAVVAALRCPECGTAGTAVLARGDNAPAHEHDLLEALEAARSA